MSAPHTPRGQIQPGQIVELTIDNVAHGGRFVGRHEGRVVFVPDTIPGDYNADGTVDAADYVVWRKDPDAFAGPQGYDDWRANFGTTTAGGSATASRVAVPEPTAVASLILAATGFAVVYRRRSGTRAA